MKNGKQYLHAGSPTSLKKKHVPPFMQNAFTGQGDACIEVFGGPDGGKKIISTN